jgi:hypothetical protein
MFQVALFFLPGINGMFEINDGGMIFSCHL